MTHQLVLTYIVHLVRAALHCVNCQDRKKVTTQLHADQRLPSVRFGPTTWSKSRGLVQLPDGRPLSYQTGCSPPRLALPPARR